MLNSWPFSKHSRSPNKTTLSWHVTGEMKSGGAPNPPVTCQVSPGKPLQRYLPWQQRCYPEGSGGRCHPRTSCHRLAPSASWLKDCPVISSLTSCQTLCSDRASSAQCPPCANPVTGHIGGESGDSPPNCCNFLLVMSPLVMLVPSLVGPFPCWSLPLLVLPLLVPTLDGTYSFSPPPYNKLGNTVTFSGTKVKRW